MDLYLELDKKADEPAEKATGEAEPSQSLSSSKEQCATLEQSDSSNDKEILDCHIEEHQTEEAASDQQQEGNAGKGVHTVPSSDSTYSQEQTPPTPSLTKDETSTSIRELQPRVPPNQEKYKILLVGVGNAPMLKKKKFLLSGSDHFQSLQARLKRMLKVPASSDLYLYVNQSFIPAPEDLIGDLGDLFSVGEELHIHYSLQKAFS
jgi:ubiquitin-like protein ATG12